MKLYLVQHGEALTKEADAARPLTRQGMEDVDRLAAFLRQAGIRVDRVIHSGKLRAVQTAERLANAIAPGVEPETSEHLKPNDDPGAFDWRGERAGRDTLVVGHLPFMARLVALLVIDDGSSTLAGYRPGSVVCLEPLEDGGWQIDWMIRPELLR